MLIGEPTQASWLLMGKAVTQDGLELAGPMYSFPGVVPDCHAFASKWLCSGKKHLYTKWEPEDERGWDQLNRPQDVIANAQSHISTGLS